MGHKIENSHNAGYHATADELLAIDEADRSGVASEEDVEAAFRSFRPKIASNNRPRGSE